MVTIIPKDRETDLINDALSELRARTDISQLVPGAKARGLLEIISRETNNTYRYFDRELLQTFIKYATGKNLELIGELLGVSRLDATTSDISSELQIQKFFVDGGRTFGSINNNSSFVIPKNTEIFTTSIAGHDAVKYRVTEDVTCNVAATEVYVSITSVEFGIDANVGAGSLVNHDFENYADYLNQSLKTTNIDGIIYARNAETDENYRYRIINKTTSAESANSIAVRTAALAVPGVSDVVIDEFAYGIGTAAIYVEAIVVPATEILIATVQDAVNRVKAAGSLIDVRSPKLSGIETTVTLNLRQALPSDEEQDLKFKVRDTIYNYINNLNIGDEFESSELVRRVLAVDTNIKSLGRLKQPIDELYIWKYSASDDTRLPYTLMDNYIPSAFERVVVEFGEQGGQTPITVKARKDVTSG